MPEVPRRWSALQEPSARPAMEKMVANAKYVVPSPMAPATANENSNPMSSRTFGPASAGTLESARQALPCRPRVLWSKRQERDRLEKFPDRGHTGFKLLVAARR